MPRVTMQRVTMQRGNAAPTVAPAHDALRPRLRRLGMGLATGLGLAPRGFFSPYRHAGKIAAVQPPYPAFEALFAAARPGFAEILALLDGYAAELTRIGDDPPPAPRWRQDWFPRLDGAVAYVLTRDRRPARIVEIGSGHSTRFFARAIADGGLSTELIAIDPAPRAALAALPVRRIGTTLQEAGLAPFQDLAAGDMLVVDSSHILHPGTDVDIILNRVLPFLPAGVLVHFHDIWLPEDYPPDWRWRGYNEQSAVGALLSGGGFAPVFASRFVTLQMAETLAAGIAARLPLLPGAAETSLWIAKTSPALGSR